MARIQATIRGIVGTNPALHLRQSQGNELPVTQFRLAVVDRYRDNQTHEWRDGDTQWITVSAFRDLAHNIAASVRKGERVIVEGTLRTQEYVGSDQVTHTDLRLEARAVGHDMRYGTSTFTRTIRTDGAESGSDDLGPGAGSSGGAADARAGSATDTYPGAHQVDTYEPGAIPGESFASGDNAAALTNEEPLVGAPF